MRDTSAVHCRYDPENPREVTILGTNTMLEEGRKLVTENGDKFYLCEVTADRDGVCLTMRQLGSIAHPFTYQARWE
jgi:hypothetical protein